MTIQVTGVLNDSSGAVSPNTPLQFVTIQGYAGTLHTATFDVLTGNDGSYDFTLATGKHVIYVKYGDRYEEIGSTIINSTTLSPLSISELLNQTEPLAPDEIAIVNELLLQAREAADRAEVAATSAEEDAIATASDRQEVAANTITVQNNTDTVVTAAAEVESDRQEVETNTATVQTNTDTVVVAAAEVESDRQEVAANTITVQNNTDTAVAAAQSASADAILAQQWATGPSGSGVDVPTDSNNAYYYSEVARNNANQTFKSGGYFTPDVGQEYPDVTSVEVDTVWLIKFANETGSYTFTTGDLAGQTVKNGFMLVYDTPVDTFDFIPTTLSGVASVNGVVPDAVGNITLVAGDFSDIYSKTEVLAITNALAARVTTLENTAADHTNRLVDLENQQAINIDDISSLQDAVSSNDIELADHETRITDVEALASNNQTALGTKADADTVIVKSHGTTGGIDVPRWTDNASRPDMTGVDKAVFGFNDAAQESELWNPETQEWGAVGGGGIPLYGQEIADFTGVKKKAYELNMLDNVNKTVTFDANFVDGDWISLSFMDWGNVAGLYVLLDFTDVPMMVRGVEYTTYRVLEPCVLQLQRIAGYWKCVGISNGSGSYYALEQRVDDLESANTADGVSYFYSATYKGLSILFRRRGSKVDFLISGTTTANIAAFTTITTLPAGFRPTKMDSALSVIQATNAANGVAPLLIQNAGGVLILTATTTGCAFRGSGSYETYESYPDAAYVE